MHKVKSYLSKEVNSQPKYFVVVFLLFALSCAFFPCSDIAEATSLFFGLGIVRFVYAIFAVILIIICGFKSVFNPLNGLKKQWLIALVALIVAINNAPIIGLLCGNVTVSVSAFEFLQYIFYCISIGLYEEFFYRGLILICVLIALKDKEHYALKALIVSSIIFSLSHLVNLFAGSSVAAVIMQLGYTFLVGMLCGLVFVFTKNLFACVLIHAVYDVGGLFVGNVGTGDMWDGVTIALTVVIAISAIVILLIKYVKNYKDIDVVMQEFLQSDSENKTAE